MPTPVVRMSQGVAGVEVPAVERVEAKMRPRNSLLRLHQHQLPSPRTQLRRRWPPITTIGCPISMRLPQPTLSLATMRVRRGWRMATRIGRGSGRRWSGRVWWTTGTRVMERRRRRKIALCSSAHQLQRLPISRRRRRGRARNRHLGSYLRSLRHRSRYQSLRP